MASWELESSICLLQRAAHHIKTITDFFQRAESLWNTSWLPNSGNVMWNLKCLIASIGPFGHVVLELSAMSFNCSFPWFVQPADLQRNVVYKQKSFHANKSPAGHVISSKNLKQQDPNEPNKYLLFSHLIFAYQTSWSGFKDASLASTKQVPQSSNWNIKVQAIKCNSFVAFNCGPFIGLLHKYTGLKFLHWLDFLINLPNNNHVGC